MAAGRVGQRRAGGEPGDVVLAGLEQHGDDVGRLVAAVFFDPGQAAGHPQQLVQRDGGARVTGSLPFGNGGGRGGVDPAVALQNADQGVGDALGHGPGVVGAVRAEPLGVLFVDQSAALDDHGRVGFAQPVR